MKRCTICKKEKPVGDFNKHSKRKDGLQSHCRECNREKSKKYYRDNKEHHKQIISERKQKVILENRQKVWDYVASIGCTDCGENDPVILEFDHLHSKSANVSDLVAGGFRWQRIYEEIQKCEVVCANCHRRRTARQFNYFSGV